MLQVVANPKRIARAIKRLRGNLKGVPARNVRLMWRGGELRTTIHWVRDDAFWWAVESRPRSDALLLGHAPDPPSRRERITCEINLPRAGTDRRIAGIIASDEHDALYLAHSGRLSKAGFRQFLSTGVWRELRWPDGKKTEALVIAPLDSPRLTRLLGHFVESVGRFKAGEPPATPPTLCAALSVQASAWAACDRSLLDLSLHEELFKRGLFGGAVDLFSLRGERPRPLFALIDDPQPEALAIAVGQLTLASARHGATVRPILIAPVELDERDRSLDKLPFTCVRYHWRGARAIFDTLDDALA
jgi:hypothetical protein